MSYPQSTKDQFLTLRADGLTYAQCAQQLNVSKHTLINWAKESKPHLDALRAIHTETLLDQYHLRQQQRIILLAGLYHRVCQTIEKTDLLAKGVGSLFTILLKLNATLDKYDLDPASLPIETRKSKLENSSETEPELNPPKEPQNTIPEPQLNPELTTPNPEDPKTEPKMNHPEVTALPIANRKSKIENSSAPNPRHQQIREEFNRKFNEHKARQAS